MPALGRSKYARDVVNKRRILVLVEVNDIVTDDEPDHSAIRLDSKWGVRPGKPLKVPSFVNHCDPHGKHSRRVGQDKRHDLLAGVLVDVIEYFVAFFRSSGSCKMNNMVSGLNVCWELHSKAPPNKIAG